MATSLPRSPRTTDSSADKMSTPPRRIFPVVVAVEELLSLRMEPAMTDFPDPLSPTMQTVSPAYTSNDTPSTARTIPSSVLKLTCKF